MSTDEIDTLLEHYLHLLDQYTALRAELSSLQSSVIPESFDSCLSSPNRCAKQIHHDIARANFSSDRGIRYGQDYYDERMRASRLIQLTPSEKEPSIPIFTIKTAAIAPGEAEEIQDAREPSSKNPLNMFGILVPPFLRSAQASAVTMVSSVIPQLASIDAEMREVEIRIRRARKYHKRDLEHQTRAKNPLIAMATRDGPTPPGILREGPAPPYVEVRFAEEWE